LQFKIQVKVIKRRGNIFIGFHPFSHVQYIRSCMVNGCWLAEHCFMSLGSVIWRRLINNIIPASLFLIENRNEPEYIRYSDAFKALLLVFKIHYPSIFLVIENKAGLELTELFNLENVSGRDIKLRNICLSRVAENYKVLKNL
jgi:hypothetical protein